MLTDLKLWLRNKTHGKIALRKRVPTPESSFRDPKMREAEIEFYSGLLSWVDSVLRRDLARTTVTSVWDVGCRNWTYLPALASAFPDALLHGAELDAFVRYFNGHRRVDVARACALEAKLGGTYAEVFPSAWQDIPTLDILDNAEVGSTLLALFLFPFVSENPAKEWGLSLKRAGFDALLKKFLEVREEGARRGIRVLGASVHQGEWEARNALHFFQGLRFAPAHHERVVRSSLPSRWPQQYDCEIFVF